LGALRRDDETPTRLALALGERTVAQSIQTTCCVVGGGPAGMMLGFLLARAGVRVAVLEKHADFLRDFRGDIVHPSTLELMVELGLIDEFLKLPHQKADHLTGKIGNETIHMADFSHLPVHCRYLALIPQWDFLNFIAAHGKRYPAFDLHMRAEVTDLIEEGGRVAGVRAKTPDGELDIRADLVVGCDGRHSTVRSRAGFEVEDIGAPIDVLWFRISRKPDDATDMFGHIEAGRMMVMLDRGDYWQCAYVIPKGGIERVKAGGLAAFRDAVVAMTPFFKDRIGEIGGWDDVKLLTVAVDRLRTWHKPGLLCIGDAAHAMSPVGGVGINLAVQDAVATANILALPLKEKRVTRELLDAVERRRSFPMRIIQRAQVIAQNMLIAPALNSDRPIKPPLPVRLMQWFPVLRRIPARFIGMGPRPEHVRTPEAAP
jgi:2-polyprenyl-6-methoxyphenol hydroxylase-like FAD-dependent oxidoreductase